MQHTHTHPHAFGFVCSFCRSLCPAYAACPAAETGTSIAAPGTERFQLRSEVKANLYRSACSAPEGAKRRLLRPNHIAVNYRYVTLTFSTGQSSRRCRAYRLFVFCSTRICYPHRRRGVGTLGLQTVATGCTGGVNYQSTISRDNNAA
jgi:hypothetical protein